MVWLDIGVLVDSLFSFSSCLSQHLGSFSFLYPLCSHVLSSNARFLCLMSVIVTFKPFCFGYFLIGFSTFAWASLRHDPCIAGMTGTHHHAQLFTG
jgi:hypothetical protein